MLEEFEYMKIEGQTIQWPKEKGQTLQNITHKTKDPVTRTPLKQGVNSDVVSYCPKSLYWY